MRLFDLHCDTLSLCEKQRASLFRNEFHVDIERGLARYDVWAQVMAAFIPDGLSDGAAWENVCRQLSYLEEQARATPCMQIVYTAHDLRSALDNGRCAVLPAVENGATLGRDITRIATLSGRGVVYITLTWNGANMLGYGCMTNCSEGLTAFGKTAVSAMWEHGVVPDTSHLNEAGFWDVAALSNGRPFIAGHSVAMSVNSHPRNLTDAQFDAIVEVGGLVGLNVCGSQLGEQTLDCVERHMAHWLSRGGENTLALGMDLDGTDIPVSWGGIAFPAKLYTYLIGRGYHKDTLNKLFFENSYTFFRKALTFKEECITIGS